jgi:rubrerythrin
MSFQFNADEIFQIAIEIERNGEIFYKKAAEGVKDVKLKDELYNLALMEKDHEATFAKLKDELSGVDLGSVTFDPNDEASSYLKALADTRIFFKKDIDMTSAEEIFKSAMTAEKDSIAFYLGMKDMVSSAIGKSKIEAIIREEMQHLKLLGTRLKELKG